MYINHYTQANNFAACTILIIHSPVSVEPSTQSSASSRQLTFLVMQWWFQTLTHSAYLPFPQSWHSQKIAMPPKFQVNTHLGFVSILSCLLNNRILLIWSTLLFSIIYAGSFPKGSKHTQGLPSFFFFFFFWLFRATPMAYGSSQAKGQTGAAYTTATETPNLSCVCDLPHSSWHHRILHPLSEARDRTLLDTSWVCFCWATVWTPKIFNLKDNPFRFCVPFHILSLTANAWKACLYLLYPDLPTTHCTLAAAQHAT